MRHLDRRARARARACACARARARACARVRACARARACVRACAFGAFAVLAAACSTTPNVTLSGVGNSPAGSFTPGLATVPVGIVLGFAVQTESATAVTAAVDDPTVATIAPAVQTSQFVVIGLATGQTTLHVYVNDAEVTELPVQVIASAL